MDENDGGVVGNRWGSVRLLNECAQDGDEFGISKGLGLKRWWGISLKMNLFISFRENPLEFYRMFILGL